MGVLAFVINKVASLIDLLCSALPSFTPEFWSSVDVNGSVAVLEKYISVANVIFPMSDVSIVIGLLFAYAIVMFSFWVAQRILNLIRGSG